MIWDLYFQFLIIIVFISLNEFARVNYMKFENITDIKEAETAIYSDSTPSSSNSSCDVELSIINMGNSGVKKTPAMKLCDEFFQWRLKESPEFATMIGVHDYDDQLDSWSEEAFAKRLQVLNEFLVKINNLLKTNIDDNDELNLKLLKDDLELVIEGMKYKGYVYPITYLNGVHLEFDRTVSWMKFKCEADYQKLLSRYRAFSKQADELISIMRLGIKEKRVLHAKSMDGVIDQFSLLQVPPEESPFYSPFESMPDKISSNKKDKLKAEGKKCVQTVLLPAFKKIEDFIKEEYMKALRPDIAASSLPDGKNHYQQCLRYHLSLPLTPQDVHNKGLQEVARITKSMEKIKNEVGFKGTLNQFFEHLHNNTEFYFTNKEDLISGYEDLEFNKITPKLLSFFPRLPEIKLNISEIPPEKANFPSAYYIFGTYDGSRPATFFVNTNFPDQRPKYEMAALALHEGLPGHHLQFSYLREEKSLPYFRLHVDHREYSVIPSHFPIHTAYTEGWGLYSEYLGEEMGIYKDPYSLFGRYTYEMLRACRMVVDTGMHAFGWSAENATAYMLDHSGMSEKSVKTEVSRYITCPGQACAYKIGEMKIKELRHLTEESLGNKFDLREFHGVILKNGAMPLGYLEKIIQEYIDKRKGN